MTEQILWSGFGLVTALQARVHGALPAGATGVSIDTRTLKPGELYFAIIGETNDGHDFVAAALEKGASAAVVDEAHADALKALGPLFVVRDTLRALESLGVASRARSKAGVIAVTGSVGKTSTKEALKLVLSTAGETHASVASYNNHWGVPLTLARMSQSAKFGVFEIGMNHAGEITPLVAMVKPHAAIVTTVAPVHLENFASVDGIADAKAEIFSGLTPNGVAIIHRDIAQFDRMRDIARASASAQVLSFGEDEKADARLEKTELVAGAQVITANVLGTHIRYRLGAPGRHMAVNSLAVLLGARALGMDLPDAARALAKFEPPSGRGQRLKLLAPSGVFTLLDESYNANPASMKAAFSLLGEEPGARRRIAVLGDMLELGPESAALHRGLRESIEAAGVDLVFASGPMMKHLFDDLPASLKGGWAEASSGIADRVAGAIEAGDIVMIKGSNGSRMGPIVTMLKERFGLSTEAA